MVTSPPADPMAASAPPRGKPQTHVSAPVFKTWGSRRFVRFCSPNRLGDATGGGRRRSAAVVRASDRRSVPVPEPADGGSGDDDWGLKELREKLLGQLREAADRMKLFGASSLQAEEMPAAVKTEAEPSSPADAAGAACGIRARRRPCKSPVRSGRHVSSPCPREEAAAAAPRAACEIREQPCKSPVRSGGYVSRPFPREEEEAARVACGTGERRRRPPVGSGGHVSSPCPREEEAARVRRGSGETRRPSKSPVRSACPPEEAARVRCRTGARRRRRRPSKSPVRSACPREEEGGRSIRLRSGRRKGMRAKFSVGLTREEIEEDIYALTGSRPGGRPKKRPRHVQRLVDSLLPGMWLTEITADSYKVAD